MESYNFSLENSSYAQQVSYKAKSDGICLLLYDNRLAEQKPVSFIFHHGQPSKAMNLYTEFLYKFDPSLPHLKSIRRSCKSYTTVNLEKKNPSIKDLHDRMVDSTEYWKHLKPYGYMETATSVYAISDNIFLVVGMHSLDRKKHLRIERAMPAIENWLRESSMYIVDESVRNFQSGFSQNTLIYDLKGPADLLTNREIQVVYELLKGKSNKQIAVALSLSNFTVDNHLRRIYKKFGVNNRTALVARVSSTAQFEI
ncbi:MAG: LuxR C-terminal-related transcriptional regulator [Porticoccaceae bacterium]|nr:response regulator transcription factor [Pseudomonadales bacterium]MCP5172358.1 response regulator transcription factor [Pseudomonadales bacterium]